ncbi:hypothetical protein B0T17DRAFT_564833 [Bombardia bombarda]|uniref:Uncharacterized protein n=1 Tax=Bombardia bombarda TaxID=252184 RepID=A0AA39TIC6_9PEZI|nr:hypothetical protein B0T17DRAFT_564833 [Bombardia bombarda]
MAPILVVTAEIANKRQDPNLQCSPATPWSVFLFFASNYLAHCATVKMYPGSSPANTLVATALALFVPSSGIVRAFHLISRNSWFKKQKSPLEKAAMAGALRMVVRDQSWEPQEGDCIKPVKLSQSLVKSLSGNTDEGPVLQDISPPPPGAHEHAASQNNEIETTAVVAPGSKGDDMLERSQQRPVKKHLPTYTVAVGKTEDRWKMAFSPLSATIHALSHKHMVHGEAFLPPGYSWAEVPGDAKVSFASLRNTERSTQNISSNYNWAQSLVGIYQAGSAGLTLYRSRGDQIERYGYAAFGLTVIPYLIMSIVNLVAQVATADYPTLYMVNSSEMEEARRRGGVFDGAVGTLEVDERGGGKADTGQPVYQARFTGNKYVEVTKVDGNGSVPPNTIEGLQVKHPYESMIRHPYESAGDIVIPGCTSFKLHKYSPGSEPGMEWSRAMQAKFLFLGYMLPFLLGCLSLIILGALTHFQNGDSSTAQRAWTMTWLVAGIYCGFWGDGFTGIISSSFLGIWKREEGTIDTWWFVLYLVLVILAAVIFCTPAIGGFVTVAGMLRDYGICESR